MPQEVSHVDGTHIQIGRPVEEEHVYVNRLSYHSINVQVVVDYDDKFTHIDATWPGSMHDSLIYGSCTLPRLIGRARRPGEPDPGVILGDSCYQWGRHLLTPIRNPVGRAEERFNRYVQYIQTI